MPRPQSLSGTMRAFSGRHPRPVHVIDFGDIRIVLVQTTHPGNIGATARAMKNMGLKQLYLVDPKDYPSIVALARAASALDILDDAVVTGTLAEAIADCSLVIGTSARQRSMPVPLLNPQECAEKALAARHTNKVALVFGREDSGLSNEELLLCNYHVQIPANPDYSSLNVASAVIVLAYELRKQLENEVSGKTDVPAIAERHWDRKLATSEDLDRMLEHMEQVLVEIGFHKQDAPRQLMARLRRLYGRIHLDQMEINILRGILTATSAMARKSLQASDEAAESSVVKQPDGESSGN